MSVYRKRERMQASEQREGLRKVMKVCSGPLQCPICDVTVRPETIATHYEQELERVRDPPPPSHKKRKQISREGDSVRGRGDTASNPRKHSLNKQSQSLVERANSELDSVRRRQLLFEHGAHTQSHDQPGPSHQSTFSVCPVCGEKLSSIEEEASLHVDSCLKDQEGGSGASSGDEYEEYTWCNVTRVRATSMLSAEARANLFNGTVMSNTMETSHDDVIDVEADDTSTYGPAQFNESHIQDCNQSGDEKGADTVVSDNQETSNTDAPDKTLHSAVKSSNLDKNLSSEKPPSKSLNPAQSDGIGHLLNSLRKEECSPIQCLICMSNYTEPLVSVLCWHVYCGRCWLQALKAQKLCPKCKRITCAGDLRRIFL